MFPYISTTLKVLTFLLGSLSASCQEPQPQATPQPNDLGVGESVILYHFIYLEPAPGLRARMVVYDRKLSELQRLPDSQLRARFDQLKRRFRELDRRGQEAAKQEPGATQWKKEVEHTKQELVTAFEALRQHGSTKAVDLDDVFSIAFSWPPVFASIGSERSQEEAERGKRILSLVKAGTRSDPIVYVKTGKMYVVRDLVLGTVQVSYDQQIAPGKQTEIEVRFEPHAILSDKVLGQTPSDQVVQWHVRPEYHPQSILAKYDFEQSGRKAEQRDLDLRSNRPETWAWTISGPRDFKADSTDLIFYLGYETALGDKTDVDVWREKIKYVEKDEPGLLKTAWNWFTRFLNWILGIIAALATIWASVKSIQLRNVELETKGVAAQASGDLHR